MQSVHMATTAPPTDRVCGTLLIKRFPDFNPHHCWTAEVVHQWDNDALTYISTHRLSAQQRFQKG